MTDDQKVTLEGTNRQVIMSDNTRLLYVKYSPVETETVVYAFFCLLPIKFIYSVPPIHSRSCCIAVVISL